MARARVLANDVVLGMLEGQPRRVREVTAGISGARLRRRPEPDEWSATEVLAHLRACGDVWGAAIATILAEEHPTIRAVNPTTWIEQTDYRELAFAPSLAAFEAQRQDLLEVLGALPAPAWDRTATVTGAGKAQERPLRRYAQNLATHERTHVKQIERIVAAVRG